MPAARTTSSQDTSAMSGAFNPYEQWCGLPPGTSRPDHYALLGLLPFESDPAVINRNFAELYSRIRAFQQGRRRQQAIQLLDEISEAFATLTDEEGKRQYDRKLQALQPTAADTGSQPPANKPKQLRTGDNSNLRDLLRALQDFDSLTAFTFYDILGVAPSETQPQSLFNFYAQRSKLLAHYYSDHQQRFRLIQEMQEALRWLSDTTRRQVYGQLHQQFPQAAGDELIRRAKSRLKIDDETPASQPGSSYAESTLAALQAATDKKNGRRLNTAEILAIAFCAAAFITAGASLLLTMLAG